LAACGGIGPSIENPVGPTGTTGPSGPTASQSAWLDPHNAVRAGTMAGVTVAPAPSPALSPLGWSTSAEQVAQAWAAGCVYAHNAGRGADGTARGENIAATASTGPSTSTPADAVAMWADEWPSYTYASNSCASGQVCGHYTQLVWRATVRVGCGHATCSSGSPFPAPYTTWEFFVCDYEPPGNVVGSRPY
jgi:pathogenesis-related protein 1